MPSLVTAGVLLSVPGLPAPTVTYQPDQVTVWHGVPGPLEGPGQVVQLAHGCSSPPCLHSVYSWEHQVVTGTLVPHQSTGLGVMVQGEPQFRWASVCWMSLPTTAAPWLNIECRATLGYRPCPAAPRNPWRPLTTIYWSSRRTSPKPAPTGLSHLRHAADQCQRPNVVFGRVVEPADRCPMPKKASITLGLGWLCLLFQQGSQSWQS